jgi:putative flippase GtrA
VTNLFGLILKYSIFALIATMVNLLTQWPVFRFYEGAGALYAAMAAGTLTGLVTKYLLDKRWIFHYISESHADNFGRFLLYSAVGGLTTVLFWGTEILFYLYVPVTGSQYLGGGLGLGIGYAVKYKLDKRFVFRVQA